MDIPVLVKYYMEKGMDDQSVLNWVRHDMQHMGFTNKEIDDYLIKAQEYIATCRQPLTV